MSKISIIVPVFNVENSIIKCVNSILSQDYTDTEIILVDDGSTDNSGNICDDFSSIDSRIKVIHKKNGGVSSARNAALSEISGDYFTFCDSDDYYKKNWISELHKKTLDFNSDVTMGNFIEVDINGNSIRNSTKEPGDWELKSQKEKVYFILDNILSGSLKWTVCSSLFKSSIQKENNIFFNLSCENYAEDLCFMLEYALCCNKISCIPSCGYCYVRHENSMISKSVFLPKLNSANAVSEKIGKTYFYGKNGNHYYRLFSIFHFFIFRTEYEKIIYSDNLGYKSFPKEIKKIKNKMWYYWQTLVLLLSLPSLSKYNKKKDKDYMLIARYSIHKSPSFFLLDSFLQSKK